MHKDEYEFLEKYLSPNDILLEWGSGNGTLYFSGLVKKVITIEHDKRYLDQIISAIKIFDIKNIEPVYIPENKNFSNRYERFKNYVDYPIENKLKFTKVLIDGRARKYCAEKISEYIKDQIVFIHDFNFNNVEGYDDDSYFSDILKNYDILDRVVKNRGIVSLTKKK